MTQGPDARGTARIHRDTAAKPPRSATGAPAADRVRRPDRTSPGRTDRVVRIGFWIVAIALGAIYAWAARHAMNSDGMSYLDVGDAWLRGDWSAAVNGLWSPLYPFLLGLAMVVFRPSAYWEFGVAHLVNFLAYLAALASLDFFLGQLLRFHRTRVEERGGTALPDWVVLTIGFSLFIYYSLGYITLWLLVPDMVSSALIYLACGLLLRIRLGTANRAAFAWLGVVLALGYLSKAALFVFGFLFLGLAFVAGGGLRKGGRDARNARAAFRPVGLALAVFLLLSAPFIAALSAQKGRLTFGDSGRLNYAWFANGVPRWVHWQGTPPGHGTPVHPTRQIFDSPRAYEFGSPVGGTYPPWYDPSYWYEGVKLRFTAGDLVQVAATNLGLYWKFFIKTQMALLAGAVLLVALGRRRWFARELAAYGILTVPGVAVLAMYLFVTRLQDPRYFAPFLLVLWLAVFCAVRFHGRGSVRWASLAAVLMAFVQLVFIRPAMHSLYPSAGIAGTTAAMLDDDVHKRDVFMDLSWPAAELLRQQGLKPGDKVAVIGDSFTQYWARLARLKIVAEVPSVQTVPDVGGDVQFWQAADSVKAQVLEALRKTGAKVVVTAANSQDMAAYVASLGWRRLGPTDYYLYDLRK